MNKILQKRIDEAAQKYAYTNWENDDYHEGAEEGMPFDPIGYLEKCFKEAAAFALQNQWISAEEALPEVDGHGYSEPVLVMSDTNELLVATYSEHYDKWNAVGPLSYHRLVVKYWMCIPSLKGGEK